MERRSKGNSVGTARDVTRVFSGDCLVRLAWFDPSNGFACGCKKDTVSENSLP